jgi:hypothetical protein
LPVAAAVDPFKSAFSWTISATAIDPVAINIASANAGRRMREMVLCMFAPSLTERRMEIRFPNHRRTAVLHIFPTPVLVVVRDNRECVARAARAIGS